MAGERGVGVRERKERRGRGSGWIWRGRDVGRWLNARERDRDEAGGHGVDKVASVPPFSSPPRHVLGRLGWLGLVQGEAVRLQGGASVRKRREGGTSSG